MDGSSRLSGNAVKDLAGYMVEATPETGEKADRARPIRRQRCHMLHDRPHHLAQRWITYRRRSAVGDLFLGPYPALDRKSVV